ncbi:MAG TPA: alternative ribosome rescue aminoacyl-tRNA hydrolase ArfB [Acidimicrobiia bacterium]|nr:alternative ribosome rescue aminoacyl-tRNA hydrolase ArfB [Acidimicrobiia bacterium]
MDDLRVNEEVTIPGRELSERFDTSGGPGGQHANRAASRVALSFDVAGSPSLAEETRLRLLERLAAQATGGVVTVVVDESRSQWRNRQSARRRLADVLAEALRPLPPPRRPTKPSRASQRRRVDEKKARGRVKRLRRRPEVD